MNFPFAAFLAKGIALPSASERASRIIPADATTSGAGVAAAAANDNVAAEFVISGAAAGVSAMKAGDAEPVPAPTSVVGDDAAAAAECAANVEDEESR